MEMKRSGKMERRPTRGENEGGWLWVLEIDDLLAVGVGFWLFRREWGISCGFEK
jgi:hypothetical protein